MVDTGGAAFPRPYGGTVGMTLRDYFAGLAVLAFEATPEEAYNFADGMLEERKKES